jgi:hypothetical protein
MTLFVKDDIKTYHVHIPRTGGRFITQTLVNNRKEYSMTKNIVRNIEEYYKKDFEVFNYS